MVCRFVFEASQSEIECSSAGLVFGEGGDVALGMSWEGAVWLPWLLMFLKMKGQSSTVVPLNPFRASCRYSADLPLMYKYIFKLKRNGQRKSTKN